MDKDVNLMDNHYRLNSNFEQLSTNIYCLTKCEYVVTNDVLQPATDGGEKRYLGTVMADITDIHWNSQRKMILDHRF